MVHAALGIEGRASIALLLERLEKATEGSRELDAEICAALRIVKDDAPDWLKNWAAPYAPHPTEGKAGRVCAMHTNGTPGVNWLAPHFTSSLDAALTLVPELEGGNLAAFLHNTFWQCHIGDIPDDKLAIRLCIAALKARAQI